MGAGLVFIVDGLIFLFFAGCVIAIVLGVLYLFGAGIYEAYQAIGAWLIPIPFAILSVLYFIYWLGDFGTRRHWGETPNEEKRRLRSEEA